MKTENIELLNNIFKSNNDNEFNFDTLSFDKIVVSIDKKNYTLILDLENNEQSNTWTLKIYENEFSQKGELQENKCDEIILAYLSHVDYQNGKYPFLKRIFSMVEEHITNKLKKYIGEKSEH